MNDHRKMITCATHGTTINPANIVLHMSRPVRDVDVVYPRPPKNFSKTRQWTSFSFKKLKHLFISARSSTATDWVGAGIDIAVRGAENQFENRNCHQMN
ncbi:hypothetical protein [uncultured Roseobacter sp.]|uniref:hypothetical protein n=1 Tax=uncultured Roseobacter sp. TaxID=114847 RepID=UPI00262EA451|nr:hypothetical protein [uncultured Roseobacter sp.]